MKEAKGTWIGDPLGEQFLVDRLSEEEAVAVGTFGGLVHVERDSQAPVTLLGQLAFFVDPAWSSPLRAYRQLALGRDQS